MNRLLAAIFLAMVFTVPSGIATADSVDLKYRSYRNWTIELPSEKWFAVKDGIKIPHAGGDGFAVAMEGNDLQFDTNGDGELDRTVKPIVDLKTGVATTRVVLSSQTKSGSKFRYAVRLRKDASGWEWAPGGALAGTISTDAGPVPIRIIDQDGNGRFNDIGRDAMVVGASVHATLLSKAIYVGDTLQNIEIAGDGKSLTLSTYDGPTAEIDMTSTFNSKAAMISSVIVSTDNQYSFDVGAIEGSVKVPAAKYRVVRGVLGLGEQRVQILAGRMTAFELTADETKTVDWGGPIASEFEFGRTGGQLQFSPDHVWYYGKAGEQYVGWDPIGKSPEFKIVDADTGEVLEVAVLPGSC